LSDRDPKTSGLSSASWLGRVLTYLDHGTPVVLVTIVATKGSTPRNVGARMIVTADEIWQTIGGGALEFDMMATARAMLAKAGAGMWDRQLVKRVLGPDMGQCCGGSLSLLLEKFGPGEAVVLNGLAAAADTGTRLAHPVVAAIPLRQATPAEQSVETMFVAPIDDRQMPLFIYGAGHVARAVVPRMKGLGFDLFLVDVTESRFPPPGSHAATHVLARHPETVAARAPSGAVHLVMTHDHALDDAICLAILSRGDFGFLGLIGSATKRARFVRRLRQAGVAPERLDRLVCPIGIAEISGKAPDMVALSVVAQLAIWQQAGNNHHAVLRESISIVGARDD
jgi:xanthine dehydrogenase accessory factor